MTVVAWLLISLVGFGVALVDTMSAYARWAMAKEAAPDDDRLLDLARSTMMSQASNVVLFGLFLVIGLTASSYPSFFPWIMFAANIVLVVSTWAEHRFRRRIYDSSGSRGSR